MKQTTRHRPMSTTLVGLTPVLLAAVLFASAAHADPVPAPMPALTPLAMPAPFPGVVAGIDGPATTTAYSDEVCSPPTVHPSDPLPPCVEIDNIETLCYPNGTAPLYLAAHAQCMCRGSFFPEWNACRRCLSVHGQISDRDLAFYKAVASAASTSLCGFLSGGANGQPTTTPTAIFRDLFTSAQAHLTSLTGAALTGASTLGPDLAPGNTAVSLYFTATGYEGPGSITGSATAATATGLALATGHPPPPGGTSAAPSSGTGTTSSSSTASSASPSNSSSAKSGAVRVGGSGVLLAVAFGSCLLL